MPPLSDGAAAPVRALLTQHGVVVQLGNGHDRKLEELVVRHGVQAVLVAMRRLLATGERSFRALVFGAENELDPPPPRRRNGHAVGATARDPRSYDDLLTADRGFDA